MYPRNAASPERLAIGAVVQISDGAVQTSGVTITVRGQGGAEGTGGGTTAYGASGVVYYTPLQAETDFTSFVVIASKTGCIPVAQTVVTTATATPGYVVAANLDVAVSTRMATYTQPTGFLAATFPGTVASTTNITAGTITTISGNVDGNVTGSVGSVVGAVGSVTGSVGSVVGLTAANLDAAVSTRLATAGYTAPDNAGIAGIKAKTDSLTFTVAGQVDANVQYVNDVEVTGVGTEVSPWGPV